ncbi:dnajc27 [Symbiodinium microadriaticum]|nr:dnajc27 [Symbiodinium microadriaticum]
MSKKMVKKQSGGGGLPPQINRIKILTMGGGNTGKSCLVKRYCEERFISKYIATIGVDYGVKPVQIDGVSVRVNFWDLSGHQEFFEIRNEFYKDAQGIILVYDVSTRETFQELDTWLNEAKKFGANIPGIPVVLCANKVDKRRVVSEDEGRQYATSKNFSYFEASASSGANVTEMFEQLFQSVIRSIGMS